MNDKKARVGKEKILEVAEKMFTEQGFKAVSIRAIAESCGVTNAALYYHFDDKASLFTEVIRRYTRRLSEHLRKAGEKQTSSRDKIMVMAKEYFRLVSNRRSIMFLIRHQAKNLEQSGLRSDFIDMAGEVLAPLDEVLQEAIEVGEVRPFPEGFSGAAILIGMLHGVNVNKRITTDSMIREEDVVQVVDYFWNGVKSRSGGEIQDE